MIGVYQTLFGCFLQIIKQATAIKISKEIDTIIPIEGALDEVSSWSIPKNIPDINKVNKDNPQAGIPARWDFFAFFSIIVSLSSYFYVA